MLRNEEEIKDKQTEIEKVQNTSYSVQANSYNRGFKAALEWARHGSKYNEW